VVCNIRSKFSASRISIISHADKNSVFTQLCRRVIISLTHVRILLAVCICAYTDTFVATYPTNIGLNEVTAMQVPDERIPSIQSGSKIAHFSWTMYICMIFSFKGVMLNLFRKVGYVMSPEMFNL
jgi:hypothetical protein